MKMKDLPKNRTVVIGAVLILALAYPAFQTGRWMANRFWASTIEAVGEQAKQITLVVGRVLTINIDGKPVHVAGSDICPRQESEKLRSLFGDASDAGQPECIVVTPATTSVQVTLAAADGPLRTEVWTVERDAGRLSFRRPDGAPVILADN